MHKATGDSSYLTKAQKYYNDFDLQYINEVFSWDDKVAGAKILLAQATRNTKDMNTVKELCQTYLDQVRSPKGRSHFMQWGSNRYASNAAFICLQVCYVCICTYLNYKRT